MHKKIGILMYQTSTSKGQELVAQRMARDFIALGHKAYLITSVYHDDTEVISSESLTKGKGYVFVEDQELGIPVIRVSSYLTKWPRRRIYFRDFVHVLEKIVDEYKLNVLITHSTLWNGPEEVEVCCLETLYERSGRLRRSHRVLSYVSLSRAITSALLSCRENFPHGLEQVFTFPDSENSESCACCDAD
jgi:hypothetical protein